MNEAAQHETLKDVLMLGGFFALAMSPVALALVFLWLYLRGCPC